MRMFQISEEDLAALEHVLPQFQFAMFPMMFKSDPANNRIRRQWQQVQAIIGHVRWMYGPPADGEVIPADDVTPDNPNDGEDWKAKPH